MNKFVLYCCLVSGLLSTCSYAMDDDLNPLKNSQTSKKQPGRPMRPLPPVPQISNTLTPSAALPKKEMTDEPVKINSLPQMSPKSLQPEKEKSNVHGESSKNLLEEKWWKLEEIPLDEQGRKNKYNALMKTSAELTVLERSIKEFEKRILEAHENHFHVGPSSAIKKGNKIKSLKNGILSLKEFVLEYFKEDESNEKDVLLVSHVYAIQNSKDMDPSECAKSLPDKYIKITEKIYLLPSQINQLPDESVRQDFECTLKQLSKQLMGIATDYYDTMKKVYAKGRELNTDYSEEIKASQALAKQKLAEQNYKVSIFKQTNVENPTHVDSGKKPTYPPYDPKARYLSQDEILRFSEKESPTVPHSVKEPQSVAQRLVEHKIAVKAVIDRGNVPENIAPSARRDRSLSQKTPPTSHPQEKKRTLTPPALKMPKAIKELWSKEEKGVNIQSKPEKVGNTIAVRQTFIRDTLSDEDEQKLREAIALSLIEAKQGKFSEIEHQLLQAMDVEDSSSGESSTAPSEKEEE